MFKVFKTHIFGSPVFKDCNYSVICKTYITSFFRFLLLSTSNVSMSEGTFCRVEVHIKVGLKRVFIARICFPDGYFLYLTLDLCKLCFIYSVIRFG